MSRSTHQLTSRQKYTKSRTLRSCLESGSADGGIFADLQFMPFLFALLIFGLLLMLVGFYRIGANYASQQGAVVGSVSPDTGDAGLMGSWWDWTGKNVASGEFAVLPEERSSQTDITTIINFQFWMFGAWPMPVNGQTYTRSERFYPGGPICNDVDGCHE
jgi:hypothetical protein